VRILLSYAYIRSNKLFAEFIFNRPKRVEELLIDSGAFSAHNSGHEITLAEYIAFCKSIHGKVERYIQLDVLENKQATFENLDAMYQEGLTPMPVLTIDMDPYEDGPKLVAYSDDICVAGGIHLDDAQYGRRIAALREACGPTARFHGLGFTRLHALGRSDLYSVDSSTWTAADRFFTLTNPAFLRGGNQFLNLRKSKDLPWEKWAPELKRLFVNLGLTANDISDRRLARTQGGSPSYFLMLNIGILMKETERLKTHYIFAVAARSSLLGLGLWHYLRPEGGYLVQRDWYLAWQAERQKAETGEQELAQILEYFDA
jgi:hypothetical protein